MPADPLPLFPLQTVLFPGTELGLRIFEARYIDMIRRCLRRDEEFGIVAIRHGGEVGEAQTYRVCTLARIVDWSATADGLLGLSVLGTSRCRFERSEREADGLYVGHAVGLLPEISVPLRAAQAWARELLATLLASEPDGDLHKPTASELDDANLVCWNLARRLPMGLDERQMLLETDDVDERFDRLRSAAANLIKEYGRE